MSCDPDQLAAYLAGDLDPPAADAVDEHLIACDACWAELIAARRGHAATATLRDEPPAGLEARLRRDILRTQPRRAHHRPVAVIALVVAFAVVAAAVGLSQQQPPAASADAAIAAALGGASSARVDRYVVAGTEISVARPATSIAMPTGRMQPTVPGAQWVMQDRGVTVLCTTRTGAIIAGAASPSELLRAAARLGLA
jgi:anti-sigma factor RsiW